MSCEQYEYTYRGGGGTPCGSSGPNGADGGEFPRSALASPTGADEAATAAAVTASVAAGEDFCVDESRGSQRSARGGGLGGGAPLEHPTLDALPEARDLAPTTAAAASSNTNSTNISRNNSMVFSSGAKGSVATPTGPKPSSTSAGGSGGEQLPSSVIQPVRLTKDGIATAADNFTKPPLGKGGFSVVHQGTFDGKPAAVKILKIRNDHESKMFEEELRAMLNPALWHANVCPLLAYCKEHPAFIFPRLTAMNVERMTRLPDDVKDSICIDVANGLWHLHKAGYVHMDMKPDNVLILFDESRRIQKAVVGDLGCVKATSQPVFPYGTIVFLDPQLKFDVARKPHPADDVYSLGITFLSIWTNRIPHMREEIPILLAMLKPIDQFRYSMIKAMIQPDLMQRPTLGYVRDVMKARQKHMWTKKLYPWSVGKVPPITQAPFIGEKAAQQAAAAGVLYVPPNAPAAQQQMMVLQQQQPQMFVNQFGQVVYQQPAVNMVQQQVGMQQQLQMQTMTFIR